MPDAAALSFVALLCLAAGGAGGSFPLLDGLVSSLPACRTQSLTLDATRGLLRFNREDVDGVLQFEDAPHLLESFQCYSSCCFILVNNAAETLRRLENATKSSLRRLFDHRHHWIIGATDAAAGEEKVIKEQLKSISTLGISSNVYLVGETYVSEIYKLRPKEPFLMERTYARPSDDGAQLIEEVHDGRSAHGRRMDMMGRPFKITSATFKHWQISVDQETGDVVGASGDILDGLRSLLNFTVEYVPLSKDGPWATKEGKAKYYGMAVGFTVHNDIDVFLDPHITNTQRLLHVDYTFTLHQLELGFVIGRHRHVTFLAFFDKLTYLSASAIAVVFLASSAIHALMIRTANQDGEEEVSPSRSGFLSDYARACADVARSAGLIWSFEGDGRPAAHKLLALTVLLTGFFTYTYYVSSMSSFFTVKSDYFPFDSLEGLAESEYTVAAQNNTAVMYAFSQARPGTVFRRIWEEKMKDYPLNLFPRQMDYGRLPAEPVCAIAEVEMVARTDGYPCKFWELKRPRFTHNLAFLVKKGSELLPLINLALLRLRQGGQIHWSVSRNADLRYGIRRTDLSCGADAEAIGPASLQFPFAALVGGCVAGTIVALAEFLNRRMRMR